jgi:predicted deacylase
VVQSQKAFEGMAPMFAKAGVIKGTPAQAAQRVDQPVSNRAPAQGAVVEERGKQG